MELVMDFEMSTRVRMGGKRQGRHGDAPFVLDEKASMFQRAANMCNASQSIMTICGNPKLPSNRNLILCQLGSAPIAGIKFRPNLMRYDAVFLELANQALLHKSEFGAGSNHSNRANRSQHWRWAPQFRHLPKPHMACSLPGQAHALPSYTESKREN